MELFRPRPISNGMNFFIRLANKISPLWPLRLGLGLMYIYSGYDLFYHPTSWVWAVPPWFAQLISPIISVVAFLRFQGIVEFLMALLLLAWFSGKWSVRIVAIFSTLEMAAVLLFTGIDLITFRDIGLLGASSALLILSFREGGMPSSENSTGALRQK